MNRGLGEDGSVITVMDECRKGHLFGFMDLTVPGSCQERCRCVMSSRDWTGGFQRVCAQGAGCGWGRPDGEGVRGATPRGEPLQPPPRPPSPRIRRPGRGQRVERVARASGALMWETEASGVGPGALEPGRGGGNRPQLGGGGFAPRWWNAVLFQVLPGPVGHWNEQGGPPGLWPMNVGAPGSAGPGSLPSCVLRAGRSKKGRMLES